MMILLILVLVVSPISMCADKDLMIRECHNAQVPTICMQCLKSDQTSVHADPIGIAGIVIHCLDSRLHTLSNNITKILSEKPEGDVIKTALKACKKDLSDAITKLSDAKRGLKIGDYDKSGQSIGVSLGFPLRCSDNLRSAEFDDFELFRQIDIYAQLSDAAMRIIDRF